MVSLKTSFGAHETSAAGVRFTTSKMLCRKLAALLHHLQLPIIIDVAFRPTVN